MKHAPRRPRCECGSGHAYAACCEPLHRGAAAASAEALMRSRYCAYARNLDDYLLASWHPDTRPAALRGEAPGQVPTWLGLHIKRHVEHDPDQATVEFVARYRVGGGSAVRLHEISRFRREQDRWYYLDGVHPHDR